MMEKSFKYKSLGYPWEVIEWLNELQTFEGRVVHWQITKDKNNLYVVFVQLEHWDST